jgi:hypothetical protein
MGFIPIDAITLLIRLTPASAASRKPVPVDQAGERGLAAVVSPPVGSAWDFWFAHRAVASGREESIHGNPPGEPKTDSRRRMDDFS